MAMADRSSLPPLPPWGGAIAGAAGAVIANAVVYPLDIVKTRIQIQVKQKPGEPVIDPSKNQHYEGTVDAIRKMVEHEGLGSLWTGMSSSLLGVASTNFAYFYWYSIVRTLYLKTQKVPGPPGTAVELSLGALAGAIAQVFTIPVAVITTRQQTQPASERKGLFATGREVIDGPDGWTGLWRGLKASIVLCVNPAITYGAYQRLKDVIYPHKRTLAAHEAFLIGALSKALATLATQPLIVAKVGLQSRPPPERKGVPFKSFTEVMRYIVANEGPWGLYKGVAPQLTKGLLVQGLLMMTKERVELLFMLLFAYVRTLKADRLQKAAEAASQKAAEGLQSAKEAIPLISTK